MMSPGKRKARKSNLGVIGGMAAIYAKSGKDREIDGSHEMIKISYAVVF